MWWRRLRLKLCAALLASYCRCDRVGKGLRVFGAGVVERRGDVSSIDHLRACRIGGRAGTIVVSDGTSTSSWVRRDIVHAAVPQSGKLLGRQWTRFSAVVLSSVLEPYLPANVSTKPASRSGQDASGGRMSIGVYAPGLPSRSARRGRQSRDALACPAWGCFCTPLRVASCPWHYVVPTPRVSWDVSRGCTPRSMDAWMDLRGTLPLSLGMLLAI